VVGPVGRLGKGQLLRAGSMSRGCAAQGSVAVAMGFAGTVMCKTLGRYVGEGRISGRRGVPRSSRVVECELWSWGWGWKVERVSTRPESWLQNASIVIARAKACWQRQ
jgi:hypothetical protein